MCSQPDVGLKLSKRDCRTARKGTQSGALYCWAEGGNFAIAEARVAEENASTMPALNAAVLNSTAADG